MRNPHITQWKTPDPHKWRDRLVFAVAIIVAAVVLRWGI